MYLWNALLTEAVPQHLDMGLQARRLLDKALHTHRFLKGTTRYHKEKNKNESCLIWCSRRDCIVDMSLSVSFTWSVKLSLRERSRKVERNSNGFFFFWSWT